MNLEIQEFNCEKAGFRAIHTENADVLAQQNNRRISEISLASTVLS